MNQPTVCLVCTAEPAPAEMLLVSIPASSVSAEMACNNHNNNYESGCCQQSCERLIYSIDQLTSTVAIENEIITKLSSQLRFVLSFMDILQDTDV
jgi:hypothetical protein